VCERFFISIMLTFILIVQLLAGAGPLTGSRSMAKHGSAVSEHTLVSAGDPGFMGFRIGMKAATALRHEGKSPNLLDHLKSHSGQRVVSDTVPLTFCKLPMRRSLGFDSTGLLSAVGLTYKTNSDSIKAARDCAYEWLSNTYGPASEEVIRDSTRQDVWKLGPSEITLEAKGYNARDYFVLIYYYKQEDKPQ
jgi:hypothetical protein